MESQGVVLLTREILNVGKSDGIHKCVCVFHLSPSSIVCLNVFDETLAIEAYYCTRFRAAINGELTPKSKDVIGNI